jgi:hypothetical protein
MTKLLPLMLIALVGCGDSGGGKGSKKITQVQIDQLQDAFLSVPRGQVILEKTQGQVNGLDFDSNTMAYTLKLENQNSQNRKVVLKVDGSRIYTLEESTDLISGESERNVEVSTFDSGDLSQTPNLRISGDVLSATFPFESTMELGDGELYEMRMQTFFSTNMKNPHCTSNGRMTDSGSRLVQNGVTTVGKPATLVMTTSCPEILSSAELKAIDLSSVDFCEESDSEDEENDTCSVQDMSWLTSDL